MSRDSAFDVSNSSEFWQTHWQQRCLGVLSNFSAINHYNTRSRGFETSRDLVARDSEEYEWNLQLSNKVLFVPFFGCTKIHVKSNFRRGYTMYSLFNIWCIVPFCNICSYTRDSILCINHYDLTEYIILWPGIWPRKVGVALNTILSLHRKTNDKISSLEIAITCPNTPISVQRQWWNWYK